VDIVKMIAELRLERAAIEEALITLERLARANGKRRGRPPAWLSAARSADSKPIEGKASSMNPEVRKRISEAQKKRWARLRKAHGTAP
jgi:hypothetical protein